MFESPPLRELTDFCVLYQLGHVCRKRRQILCQANLFDNFRFGHIAVANETRM